MPEADVKIVVTPEGRPELWLAERSSLKAWIGAQGFEQIHNFGAIGAMCIGADHDVDSVLADIDAADRVALLMGDARKGNMGHALALIVPDGYKGLPERLEMYDIGDVTDDDLAVNADV